MDRFELVLHKFYLSKATAFGEGIRDIIFIFDLDDEKDSYIGLNFYIQSDPVRETVMVGWNKDHAEEEISLGYDRISIEKAKELGFPIGSIPIKHLLTAKRKEGA